MRDLWHRVKRDTIQFLALLILLVVLAMLLILGAPAR